jgi:hypothetical protein
VVGERLERAVGALDERFLAFHEVEHVHGSVRVVVDGCGEPMTARLSRRATAPAVALMDQVCPPSTVYAAYNGYAGPKEIRVYPYNDHEGGEGFQQAEQLSWLKALLSW